jgi:hypothetical protein
VLLAAIPPVDDPQLRTATELPFGSDWDVSRFSATTLGWTATMAEEARRSSFGLFRFNVRFQPHIISSSMMALTSFRSKLESLLLCGERDDEYSITLLRFRRAER